MEKPIIQLLLATYNEARYVDEFFRSLQAQTEQRFAVLVRDDGSTDRTPERLRAWQATLGDRLVQLPGSGTRNLGVAGNFSALLAASGAPYVMFANPDDVWHPDKIAVTLAAMLAAERRAGAATPILVHTDLRVVDPALRCIGPSLWRYQGLVPRRGHALARVCVENCVWGCTAMLNRALVAAAGDIPAESHHEDWWVALVAAAFGRIVSLPQATLDWRRHDANDSAVSRLSDATAAAVGAPLAMRRRLAALLSAGRPRVRAFRERYAARLSARQLAALDAFLALERPGAWRRRIAVLRHGLWFTSWRRNLGLMLLL